MATELTEEWRAETRSAWAKFLQLMEPVRPALGRYCRRLTGDIWDAEDLHHDTMLRGFALLGSVWGEVADPRAYMLRIATNLYIDGQRRRLLEDAILADAALAPAEAVGAAQEDAAGVRDAGSTLLRYLAPQERAAVLLKDVFDMNLEEIANVLGTSVGAVKAALHRGRGRLKEVSQEAARPNVSAEVMDAFVARFNARDLDGLLALMLDSAAIEMSGIANEIGRDQFTRGIPEKTGWFFHTVIGFPGDFIQPTVRWERRDFEGEPVILQFSQIEGEERMSSVIRLSTADGQVARLCCYTFCPDAMREVASALGLTVGPAFYSFEPFMAYWASVKPPA